jgi:hypothetical protein
LSLGFAKFFASFYISFERYSKLLKFYEFLGLFFFVGRLLPSIGFPSGPY